MGNRNSELTEKIENLKKTRGAVILAHNYQLGAIQEITNEVSGSLELIFAFSLL